MLRAAIVVVDAVLGMIVSLVVFGLGLLVLGPSDDPGELAWARAALVFCGLVAGPLYVSVARWRVLDEAVDVVRGDVVVCARNLMTVSYPNGMGGRTYRVAVFDVRRNRYMVGDEPLSNFDWRPEYEESPRQSPAEGSKVTPPRDVSG